MNTSPLLRTARSVAIGSIVIATLLVPSGASLAGLPTTCTAQPMIIITEPAEAHAFAPGESVVVAGEACDDGPVASVRLDYWLGSKLALRELATCDLCGLSGSVSWTHSPALDPGYYVVKATAFSAADPVTNSAQQSNPASRSFATGLQALPALTPPPVPLPEGVDAPPTPLIGSPDPKEVVPAADRPTTVSGRAEPGSDVTIYRVYGARGETLGEVTADRRGRWSTQLHLPSGRYRIGAQATDDDGNVSPLSKIVGFTVDADRPVIDALTEEGTVFGPLEPVTIEGHLLDNRKVGYLVVEYWLLNEVVFEDKIFCPACDQQDMVWSSTPELPNPGYYYVRVRGFDKAGNNAWAQATTFVSTSL